VSEGDTIITIPAKVLFEPIAAATLAVDNKQTRIIPGLVMPGEAEDIWHRAMAVYRHIRGHRYDLSPQTGPGEPRILDAAAAAHLAYFGRDTLLVKSPFCSFRIPQIERHWGAAASYLHIIGDQAETADSIRRNHFEFSAAGKPLSSSAAWALFVAAVTSSAPADRTTVIRHRDLVRWPYKTVTAAACLR
jgi:hypothetical protein